jgi:hypothetical protein
MAEDKKGKGSGTKDACYHKVKSRYSVWPSAYASGALVKCRKVGAANWGNKSESFEINPEKHKEAQRTAEREDKLRKRAKSGDQGSEIAAKKTKGPKMMGEGKYSKSETYVKGTAPVRATYGGKTESFPKETYKKKSKKVEVSEGDKYDNVGKQAARMSLLNNPSPRSTPEQTAEKKARLEKKRGMKLDDHPQFKKEEIEQVAEADTSDANRNSPAHRDRSNEGLSDRQIRMKKFAQKRAQMALKNEEVDKRRAPAELVARLSAKREGHMAQDGPNKAAYDAKQRILKKTKDKMTEEIVRSILDEAGKKCWKGYKKAGTQKLFGKTYNRCVKANEETEVTEGRAEDAQASLAKVKDRQKVLDAHEKKTGKKLDITKTPEYKSHKQNFPGAKRTGKKVPGAKETDLETHNRRVNKTTARIVDRGYTSKEKKEVEAMAKHTSRFD